MGIPDAVFSTRAQLRSAIILNSDHLTRDERNLLTSAVAAIDWLQSYCKIVEASRPINKSSLE